MPCYAYRCSECKATFDITKPMAESGRVEHCECGAVANRVFIMPMLNMWSIDPMEFDGEKEAIDAGMYE